MNRNKKRFARPGSVSNIDWLKHRTGYPSPEERKKIIELRGALTTDLLMNMLSGAKPDNPRIKALVNKYGEAELIRAMQKMEETMEMPSLIGDAARSYRDYRLRYAKFGAGLKFLSAKELDDAYMHHAEELMEGDTEIGKTLLIGWREWDDITPPAIPLRPEDFSAPAPTSYPAPINELLEWGDDLNRSHYFETQTEAAQWKKHIPALTRMALDPGLLNGWPSEKASWAPWHAIHALGSMEVWESAPALAALANLENDWLSDHLPHIWADMGKLVEPSLWITLESSSESPKARGLAAEALSLLANDDEPLEDRIVSGFEKILKNEKTFDRTLNAYLLHTLSQMEILGDIEETAISALENGRVDEDIFSGDSLHEELDEEEGFDDDLDDEFDEDDIEEDEG